MQTIKKVFLLKLINKNFSHFISFAHSALQGSNKIVNLTFDAYEDFVTMHVALALVADMLVVDVDKHERH